MLLFISYKQHKYYIWRKFQYITCYSLSHSENIHCMDVVLFQYITCYSLSFRWELHSVTVFLFQYITCYSLSLRVFSDLVRVLMFQYITCYSLSDVQHLLLVNYIGFNTSHVTLYQVLLLSSKQH